ncbi:hypothetical protein QVG61_03890 [Thiohalobacter sp. IOR34]|uniref:hypothetical protein n=1 Tax=Thiohalobacter sp. IOR34 TaxID=3057176 RepID=UPI0025AF50B0|nr:hypothetical protein [Thiohalobacter sp. IOR34]WJW76244.1 hypothetical protein QVG61_03890 [Thiohalobacter sp. IOR34]
MDQRFPTRRTPVMGSFDTRPARVEQWIANLPLLNLGETSRQLFNALVEINSLDINLQQRFKVLELLRTPVAEVTGAMQKHYIGQHFPLPEKARKVADLSQAMLNQLAIGYRIVVAGEADKGRLLRDRRLLTSAVHRALSSLGQVLLKAYQIYAPYPQGVWREIHQLYALAEQHKLLDSPVKDAAHLQTAARIEDAYKQILLLALACPYRLRQGEVNQVFEVLEDWAGQVRLTRLGDPEQTNVLFLTHLASDDPPSYLALRHSRCSQADCRLLDTAQLAETVRNELSRRRKEGRRGTPAEGTLRRLMLAWGVMPRRKFSRAEKHATAAVAIGLSATHFFVSGEQVFSPQGNSPRFETPAHFEASDPRERQETVPDVWDPSYVRQWHPDQDTVRMVDLPDEMANKTPLSAPAEETSPAQPAYTTEEWKMVDVSAGGYRLLWTRHEQSPAEVGELLGVRESSDPDVFHLALGVIRWMKCSDAHGLELGVQMISPGAVAVGTRLDRPDGGSEYMRSLILPEVSAIGQPASLLTPALPYHVGDRLVVNCHGKEARVELTKLVENTGCFAQFQFRPLDNRPAGESGGRNLTPEDFESLWNEI